MRVSHGNMRERSEPARAALAMAQFATGTAPAFNSIQTRAIRLGKKGMPPFGLWSIEILTHGSRQVGYESVALRAANDACADMQLG